MAVATKEDIEFLWKWRKYLLLLATQVASFTYVAGLNPPGVDQPVPSVVSTDSSRYAVFFYCNDAAFVASLVVIMFLLERRIIGNVVGLTVLRLATLHDLLALMAAFVAGSSRDVFATIYVSALFVIVFAYYVAVHVSVARLASKQEAADSCAEPRAEESHLKERRKFLLLLASFATPLTYAAGLAPPGGFWSQTKGDHRAGAPLLHDGRYKIRYDAFFYANASSFVASLASIMLLMSSSLSGQLARSYALPVCALVELLGLMAAFAAGSTRSIPTTVYIISLVGTVLLYIMLLHTFKQWSGAVRRVLTCIFILPDAEVKQVTAPETGNAIANVPIEENEDGATKPTRINVNNGEAAEKLEESRSLLMLLATLAATVTYQAGLSPPGGVWPGGNSHRPGYPVLLDMQPKRYMAFYHCNSTAFVASLIVIIIVQSKELSWGTAVRRGALHTVMILGLFALMGAYVAGSCRDTTTTIYGFSLAIAVVVYSIAKVVSYTAYGKSELIKWVLSACKKLPPAMPRLPPDDDHHKVLLERRRKFLLELAILAATLTYQTGLNPPGGFSPEDKADKRITAGDPVLLDYNRTRYQVFFYCNATGFMVSLAVIQLLLNRTHRTRQGIRSNVLHVCVLVELLGFLGAYAAGNGRKLRTSIYVFSLLVAPVVTFVILQILLFVSADRTTWSERPWLQCVKGLLIPLSAGQAPAPANIKEVPAEQSKKYLRHKDVLMLLGMLGASVTYQAGLAPPGGATASGEDDAVSSPWHWPSPSSLEAGNPIQF